MSDPRVQVQVVNASINKKTAGSTLKRLVAMSRPAIVVRSSWEDFKAQASEHCNNKENPRKIIRLDPLALPNTNKYLQNLFLEDQFSDVKLVTVCGKELNAHKCILAAGSSTFAAMFKHDMLEKKSNIVKISDVRYEVLKEMLRFIYTDYVENIANVVTELFIASDKYDIQDLKNKCENSISNGITVETAIQIFEFADKYNAVNLKNQAMHFMKSNIDSIMKNDAFKNKLQLMGPLADFILFLIKK